MRNLIAISTILVLSFIASSCAKKDTVLHMIEAPDGQVIGDREAGYKLVFRRAA